MSQRALVSAHAPPNQVPVLQCLQVCVRRGSGCGVAEGCKQRASCCQAAEFKPKLLKTGTIQSRQRSHTTFNRTTTNIQLLLLLLLLLHTHRDTAAAAPSGTLTRNKTTEPEPRERGGKLAMCATAPTDTHAPKRVRECTNTHRQCVLGRRSAPLHHHNLLQHSP